MEHPHALIVDDSRTAQLRLKRLLEVYELEVDLAASAEEALSYLSYRSPAVIFLDESMEGMNGIDALRTIKLNPGTATIPVIMYTSQSGEMFTSQARALGALDVLEKGQMAPANLDAMMQRLKIPRRATPQKPSPPREPTPPPRPIPAAPASNQTEDASYVRRLEFTQLQQQVARLFEIHIANVNRQISKSTQFVVKRFQVHADKASKTPTEVVVGNMPLDAVLADLKSERERNTRFSNILLGVVLVALLIVGWLVALLLGRIDALQEQSDDVAAEVESNSQRLNEISASVRNSQINAPTEPTVSSEVVETLGWLSNEHFSFDLGEEPLGQNMVPRLQELVARLSGIGYEGVVGININFGNVCYAPSTTGELVVAPGDMSAVDCVMRAGTEPTATSESYQTLAFTNFRQSAAALRDQRIVLTVNRVSFENPRFPYPSIDDTTVAADWNHAAAKNNYLSFEFAATNSDSQ